MIVPLSEVGSPMQVYMTKVAVEQLRHGGLTNVTLVHILGTRARIHGCSIKKRLILCQRYRLIKDLCFEIQTFPNP